MKSSRVGGQHDLLRAGRQTPDPQYSMPAFALHASRIGYHRALRSPETLTVTQPPAASRQPVARMRPESALKVRGARFPACRSRSRICAPEPAIPEARSYHGADAPAGSMASTPVPRRTSVSTSAAGSRNLRSDMLTAHPHRTFCVTGAVGSAAIRRFRLRNQARRLGLICTGAATYVPFFRRIT